ncbi:MAG: AMMECR1 domain-containing protein [Deltaproteobacteria bacterium]|nr:MAG: AMMECR1 domain-containing protein [Deltaproteobacteria bacterium]
MNRCSEPPLTPAQGAALVKLARHTLETALMQPETGGAPDLSDAAFDRCQGVFVTLHKTGVLRGCIGSLEGRRQLRTEVAENARSAAFEDPRFPPLSAAELALVDLEVSVLSEPQPLDYASADDLLGKLRPGIDGVILAQGRARATFLPQVWDQLPDATSFLGHLCMKAGLPENAWRQGRAEIWTYQVQYFTEA